MIQYFAKDFWRSTDHKGSGRKRTRFSALICALLLDNFRSVDLVAAMLINLGRRRPEVRYDLNRVKLAILAVG